MLAQMKINFLIVVCMLLLNRAAQAEDIQPIDCMIEPNITVELSSPVSGVLDTLTVDRSDEVKKGDLVATLKSDAEKVSVKTSEERLKLSALEHKRAVELYREKAITLSDRDKLENEKILYELDLQHAKANLNLRQIRSPIDGVVVKLYSTPGEFVETKPIIKLAQVDPLKIEVVSPVSNYGKIVKGMRARILPEFGVYQDLVAEVVVVDKVIDAASGTFGVRLELANKDHTIPGGLKCKVHFFSEAEQADYVKQQNVIETLNQQTDTAAGTNIPDKNNENISSSSTTEVSTAEEALICLSIGPYKKQMILNKLIDKLGSDVKHSELRRNAEVNTTYSVVSEAYKTRQEAIDKMQSMKKLGMKDIATMKKNGRYHLSFGLFSRQSLALNRLKTLQHKGYKVRMSPVDKEINTYWADIVYLPLSDSAIKNIIPETYRVECDEAVITGLLN
ncbi:MAG: efflux RND transporter periplasmic adaptor subunit [Gammaproteobacteria bacterium]